MVAFIGAVPSRAVSLQRPFQECLQDQQQKLFHQNKMHTSQGKPAVLEEGEITHHSRHGTKSGPANPAVVELREETK